MTQSSKLQTCTGMLLHDPKDRSRETPELTDPEKLGSFSMKDGDADTESSYMDNDSNMRVLSVSLPSNQIPAALQHFRFNLLDGYTSAMDGGWKPCAASSRNNSGLGTILFWIQQNGELLSSSERPIDYDFVAKNGALYRIMNTVHEQQSGWCIAASKFKGTIYLFRMTTEQMCKDDEDRSEFANQASYGGFRFEKHISKLALVPGSGQEDNQSHGEHYLVTSAVLGSHKLLYASEMDCLKSKDVIENPEPHDFLEIKTGTSAQSPRQKDTRLSRMFRWWSQATLSGAAAVVVGNREKDFYVRSIEVIKTADMPQMCRHHWSSKASLVFFDRFLQFVQETVVEDDPEVMYEFNWKPTDARVSVMKRQAKPDRRVLPDWYIKSF